MMFAVNQNVVYPGHGVAVISNIITKDIGDKQEQFFELSFVGKKMTILIPVDNIPQVGVRVLSSPERVDQMIAFLQKTVDIEKTGAAATAANWNKRSKEYQARIRTGNIEEIAKIYRDLCVVTLFKGLSFGEKNLLQQTELLLVEEIALVLKIPYNKAVEVIREATNHLRVVAAVPAEKFTVLNRF